MIWDSLYAFTLKGMFVPGMNRTISPDLYTNLTPLNLSFSTVALYGLDLPKIVFLSQYDPKKH